MNHIRAKLPAASADILLILILPVLLIIINPNWIFTPRTLYGIPDPWFYFSYFHHFYDFAPIFPSNIHYFVERLSWNVPGYYIYHLFPPLVANIILHLAVYCTAALSLYGTLRILFNRHSALITTLLLGSYTWFLRAVGWDYTDGVGIGYFLLTVFLLTFATMQRKHWKASFFAAGITICLLVISNPFWIGYMPAIAAYFALIYVRQPGRRMSSIIIFFLLGALLSVLLIGLFYKNVTGEFSFVYNSLAAIRKYAHNVQNSIDTRAFYQNMPPYWHVLPILIALTNIALLLKTKQMRYRRAFLACSLLFTLSYSCLTFWHFYSNPFLFVFLYSSFLIPSTFLLLGSQISTYIKPVTDKQFRVLIVSIVAIALIPLLISTLFPAVKALQQNVLLAIICIGIFVLAHLVVRQARLSTLLVALSIAVIGFIGDSDFLPHVFIPDRYYNINNFLAVEDAIHAVNTHYSAKLRDYGSFKFWFPHNKYSPTYTAIASVYLFPWGNTINYFIRSETFTWDKYNNLNDKDHLIIMSENATDLDKVNEILNGLNAHANLDSIVTIDRGDIHFDLLFTTVSASPRTFDLDYGEKFEFDETINRPNWYKPELWATLVDVTWSGPETKSNLNLRLPQSEIDAEVQICIAASLAQDITESLRLYINDVLIVLQISNLPDCPTLYTGMVPQVLFQKESNDLLLTLEVNRTTSWKDVKAAINAYDKRKFGLAFDWIKFVKRHDAEQ